MARIVTLPRDPCSAPGTCMEQTEAVWLVGEMRDRGFSSGELFRDMRRLGFDGTSANIVSLWRSGNSTIPLDRLPCLMTALGIGAVEQRLWILHFLHGKHPELSQLLTRAA